MIEFVVSHNPDPRLIARAARALAEGGLVALPTDASWIIACSLGAKDGIKRLKRLAANRDERHFTLVAASIAELGEYCSLDNTRFRLIKRLAPGPYVFLLKSLLGTDKALDIKRKEVGVRLVDHPLYPPLLAELGAPLYSVTAKRSMADGADGDGEADGIRIAEEELFEAGHELEAIGDLALVLDDGEERPRVLTTVLDLTGDEALALRSGAGPWPI